MEKPSIRWIETDGKNIFYLKIFALLMFCIGLTSYVFDRSDILVASLAVIFIGCFPMILINQLYMNYSFGITEEKLYVKRNRKDFISEKWENIIHDGHVMIIDGIRINFKAYHDENTKGRQGFSFGYNDEELEKHLIHQLKKAKKISTSEMKNNKTKEIYDIKTILLVGLVTLLFVIGYVYYSLQYR